MTPSAQLGAAVQSVARIFLPPAPLHDPQLEFEFQALRTVNAVAQRRAALFIFLLTWTFFAVWDWNISQHDPANLNFILTLRSLGEVALLGAMLLSVHPGFAHGRLAERVIVLATGICIALLLGLVLRLSFPTNYLYYLVYLLLLISLLSGAFQLPARMVVVSLAVLVVAGVVLAYASFAPDGKGATLTAPSLLNVKGQLLRAARNYYYLAALAYLVVFALVGCAVAVALERSSRQSFIREDALTKAKLDVERRTGALVAAERELKEQAERQNSDKSRFLADAAHDLSQPMHAVSLLLDSTREAARQGDLDKVRELTEAAGRAADATRASFRAVLDISQLEAGNVSPRYVALDAQNLVDELVETLRPLAKERGVRLTTRRTSQQAGVMSDRMMLSRVVGNLLANAIKYADASKADRQAVLIGLVVFSNRVRIDVVDNGLGIPRQYWQDIFEPFVQLENPERNREKGLGLGLSIVKASIERLAGHELDMHSQEGRGTRFSIAAPRSVAALSTPPDHGVAADVQVLKDLFVWYIEDDTSVRHATLGTLEAAGLVVEDAGSVAELRAKLTYVERAPDLVISDYRLPEGKTAADVRRLLGEALPTLVITGEVHGADWMAREAGVRVLRKPLSSHDLISALAELASLSRPALVK